ncbi:MAG TPA: PIN domain-containing protein [Syntrophothermus lipocalidus]|nr:PIN domain-containing protein [Syntrophothermus lipocalidus]
MKLSGKVAIDANAILSALIGGKAVKVFVEAEGVEFVTTARVSAEVREYIPVLAKKKGLNRGNMEAIFSLLNLEIVPEDVYRPCLPKALDLGGKRDPDDADLVALALALNCPVWTNDNDLIELAEIKTLTTAEFLFFIGGSDET